MESRIDEFSVLTALQKICSFHLDNQEKLKMPKTNMIYGGNEAATPLKLVSKLDRDGKPVSMIV